MNSLLLPLLASLVPAQETAPATRVSDPVADLVPTDAAVVVRLASLDRFSAVFDQLDALAAPESRTPAEEAIAQLFPFGAEHLHRDRPVYVAFILADGPPMPTYVVPVTDADAFQAALAPMLGEVETQRVGDYVGFGMTGPYTAGGSRLLAQWPADTVTARVDMETIRTTFGPVIEMGLVQMVELLGSAETPEGVDIDMSVMAEMYAGGIRAALESLDILELSGDVTEGRIDLDMVMRTLEGSPMTAFGSAATADYRQVLARTVNDGSMQFLAGMDYSEFLAENRSWMEALLAIYPEELRKSLEAMTNAYVEVYEQLGNASAGFMSFEGGMQMAFVTELAAAGDAFTASMLSVFDAGAGSELYTVAPLEPVTIAGLEVQRRELRMDMESLAEVGGVGEESETLYRAIYGGDVIPYALAHHEKRALMYVGNDPAKLERSVKALVNPTQPSTDLARAAAAMGKRTPAFAMSMDVARLMSELEGVMAAGGIPTEEIPQLEGAIPMLTWAVVDGLDWRWHLDFGLQGFAQLMKQGR